MSVAGSVSVSVSVLCDAYGLGECGKFRIPYPYPYYVMRMPWMCGASSVFRMRIRIM
jgi:hypothetical protein